MINKNPKWKLIEHRGPQFKLIGIEPPSAGTIGNLGKIVITSAINSYLPVDGYDPPIKNGDAIADAEISRASGNVGPNAKLYPNDDRLIKVISWSPKADGTGNATIIRPYNSDDMTDGTGGLFNPDETKITEPKTTKGVPALINNFAIVQLRGAYSDANDKMHSLIDTPGKRKWYEDYNFRGASDNPMLNDTGYSKDVTVSKLIDLGLANKRKSTPYFYTDFAYCKYFNKIPNNYLITLRRFAVPTFDSLDFPYTKDSMQLVEKKTTLESKDKTGNIIKTDVITTEVETDPSQKPENDYDQTSPPIAQAVTWLGERTGNTLESVLGFSVGLPWEDLKAQVWDNTEQLGDADSASGMPGWMKGFAKSLSIGTGDSTNAGMMHDGQTPPDPYDKGPYQNRIMGPVNRIDSVKRRTPGMDFKQSISLKFDYCARSLGGINTKAAMLDIIANFMLLTYGTGGFWGGANRFRGESQAYPWKKGMAAWYSGNPIAFMDAIGDSLTAIGDNLSNLLDNLLKDPIGTLKAVAVGGAEKAMAFKLRGKSPMFHGMRALLTGEPVGEWHLVVGNPMNPIMMIGNLVCTGCAVKFGNELGPDDFPTEVSFTITLEHGMPRDRYGIESMFNKGSGRIYTLPDGFEEQFSSANETAVDKNTGNKNNPWVNKIMGVDKIAKSKGQWVDSKSADFDKFLEDTREDGIKVWGQTLDNGSKLAAVSEMGYNNSSKFTSKK